MKFKTLTEEEIALMSFDDLAYAILKEKGHKMKIADIFKTICELQGLSDSEYESHIAEFFTLLSTEKRFIGLDKGYWDLRENHTSKIELDGLDEDEIDEEDIDTEIEDTDNDVDDIYDESSDTDDDDTDDDLKDLVVIDEENEADL